MRMKLSYNEQSRPKCPYSISNIMAEIIKGMLYDTIFNDAQTVFNTTNCYLLQQNVAWF